MVHMGSSILKEQMEYESIVGHRLPWDCISLRCSTALWIRPLGQRLGVWPFKKTTCFGLGTWTVSQPSHKSHSICVAHIYLVLPCTKIY
ncbi:unnamed protein product, partial [Schistosoma rodhaini]|uniref:Uncharacterized protein n=1 Tax=Schistosoma rodhaini TaxID=6188 RepID=A0AA85FM95_9TREM